MRKRQFMFRLFYNTTFSVILIIEILLLLISPGDIIYQSFAANRTLSIIAVAIVYVAVLLISSFIIATRFYTAHTQLSAIPKDHIPIRKNELSKSVFKIINSELERSASIAYHAHPREVHQEDLDALGNAAGTSKERTITWSLDHVKTWRDIQHAGWSSPCNEELRDLQFEPVLAEFPHLLEAKAVSMAPMDPLIINSSGNYGNTAADPIAVEFLQRPASMPLWQYVQKLADLDMLEMDRNVDDFLKNYERTRFMAKPVSEDDFRYLLEGFSRVMTNLEPPTTQAFQDLYKRSYSMSTASLDSVIRKAAPGESIGRDSNAGEALRLQLLPDTDLVSETATPYSHSMTPFMTPMAHRNHSSLSSGHAGDRSSDSELDDEGAAATRHSRRSRTTNISRYVSAATGIPRSNDIVHRASQGSRKRVSSDAGSVVHRIAGNHTNPSQVSLHSTFSQGSVIHREDLATETLPLPIVSHGSLEEDDSSL